MMFQWSKARDVGNREAGRKVQEFRGLLGFSVWGLGFRVWFRI